MAFVLASLKITRNLVALLVALCNRKQSDSYCKSGTKSCVTLENVVHPCAKDAGNLTDSVRISRNCSTLKMPVRRELQ